MFSSYLTIEHRTFIAHSRKNQSWRCGSCGGFHCKTIYCSIKYKKKWQFFEYQVHTNYSKLNSIIHFGLWPNIAMNSDKRWKNNQQTENTTQQQFIGIWYSWISHAGYWPTTNLIPINILHWIFVFRLLFFVHQLYLQEINLSHSPPSGMISDHGISTPCFV